ncbi:TraR/DksA family transcriptional regulator [Catellatospora tritici]|uniref:TraR/DksA family transcriptional regulator n=1 Tax=Catellatospora tritici TaxID=2851566 RepID=UPI001C2D8F1A|nr:TraR/DksA C4-type zinc finger protein [Catellatospora tritici]
MNATDIENEELVAHSLQQRRDQLIEALTRLRDGTYGTCATCRQPIMAERLLASPAATHCVRCQTTAERHPGWKRTLDATATSHIDRTKPTTVADRG